MVLILFLILLIAYAIFAVIRLRNAGGRARELRAFLFSSMAPMVIAVGMIYVFVIAGAATTVQFNAGGGWQMNAWSLWVDLWPLFLILAGLSSIGNFIWFVIAVARKSQRHFLVPAAFGTGLSVMAFFTVGTFFPTA